MKTEEINKKLKKNESSLKEHKRNKKELNPPILAGGLNLKPSSWYNDRLPEMLWAVLIIGNSERSEALQYFRYIAKYVENNQVCYDITLTGISKLPDEKRKSLINYFTHFSKSINSILQPMLFFPELPCISDWKEVLQETKPEEDLIKLFKGVFKTFGHQSQEATDCRWIRMLCGILGGKIHLPQNMEDVLQGIIEYPNFGDIRRINPTIRTMEIAIRFDQTPVSTDWAKSFWEYCYKQTECIPEEESNKKISLRMDEFSVESDQNRKHFYDETVEIRNKIIDHFYATSKTSAIDSRHEGSIGLTLYAFSIFIEIIFFKTSFSITGRISLRCLVESLITFVYLLNKEKTEPKIWDDYRSYGSGQIKLIYLKLRELNQNLSSIDIGDMDLIANEDKWVEFLPINLGHWDSANLRIMAEDFNLKDLYDKFYNYTSGFIHGNWGAVRESVYQKCINPLHRYHRIPINDLPLMPNVTKDAMEIMNSILDCLDKAYPEFKYRLTTP